MASLQNTTVPNNGYYRVGTSTDKAYVSSGGVFAHFGNDVWYDGNWRCTSGLCTSFTCGPFLQLYNYSLFFYTSATTFVNTFSVSAYTTVISSTTTTIVANAGNSTTNSTLGVGAAAGTAATDGKILVNAGGTTTPFLEVTNCLGDGSTSTATKSVFKGFLGIKIGSSVGGTAPQTAITAGTYYIRLWG